MASSQIGRSQIIRISRTDTDAEGGYILCQVTSTGPRPFQPLNVKLVATEGEEPYMLRLKHDRIGELRVKNSPCSPDEWERILKSLLVKNEPVEGIEAGAEASTGKEITITIRRMVAGISQRLGALTLPYAADEDIELFEWCGAAALEREKFSADLAVQVSKVQELESCVDELKKQLDELVQSKREREAELLEKFCTLLNEKKVKIREQQRMLDSGNAKPPTSRPAAAAAARSPTPPTPPSPPAKARRTGKKSLIAAFEGRRGGWKKGRVQGLSRATKRKVLEDAPEDAEASDGEAFEKMDVDEAEEATAKQEEADDRQTTDKDETGSEPDDEDEDEESVPPPTRSTRQRKKPEPEPEESEDDGPAAHTRLHDRLAKGKGKEKEALTHQPKRPAASSPKVKATRSAAAAAAATPAEDEMDTESDDEL
ncbi:DNA repair protein XRCC4 [Diplogelasinospora grovesii]|uniref:DNA repair protein XRCC4 n=1 Tax=Diplogelasinospora grovesii TaxID=303347 RepID=A0AAN6SAY2_9PEZI|nr:DNA repair protein XRCC4 [Diplogelasinospora grovesii]